MNGASIVNAMGPAPFALTYIPIRTVNELNDHKHWRTRQRRAKEQRGATMAHMLALATRTRIPTQRVHAVKLTRIAPSNGLDAHDGLPASCKHVVDGVADFLGKDDGRSGIAWTYDQRRGAAREYAVEVRLEWTP